MLIEREHAEQLCASASLQAECADVVQTLSEGELRELLPQVDGWIAAMMIGECESCEPECDATARFALLLPAFSPSLSERQLFFSNDQLIIAV